MQNTDTNIVEQNQWHFIDKDSTTGIIIFTDSIILHTSAYTSYHKFHETIGYVLTKFNEVLKINLCTRIGLRYTNFINKSVDEHINNKLHGFLPEGEDSQKPYIAKTETIQETDEGLIKIQSSHISNKDVVNQNKLIRHILLPSDLQQGAELISFEKYENRQPDNDYMIGGKQC